METVLFASHNPSKIKRYQALFQDFSGLKLVTLADIGCRYKCPEPHGDPESNAIFKAREYARLSGLPTLAVDEAVTTNFLPEAEQPGVMVRRLTGGRELTDQEIIVAWQGILARYPGKDRAFTWDYWLAYYDPASGLTRSAQALKLTRVSARISEVLTPGYPMSSFLIPEGFDRPFSELSPAERLESDSRSLGPFRDFLAAILAEKANKNGQISA